MKSGQSASLAQLMGLASHHPISEGGSLGAQPAFGSTQPGSA